MNKRKVILPCAYLPPVEYFTYFTDCCHTVIEVHEHYKKQTYRNRCEIVSASGKLALSVPVIKTGGNHTRVKDLVISYQQKWQRVHWGAISAAYSSSPFFVHYRDLIQPYYEKQIKYLIDLNLGLTDTLLACSGLNGSYELTRHYEAEPPDTQDLRLRMSPKKEMKKDFPSYQQVFASNVGFIPNMSMIDLLFNLGPESKDYLLDLEKSR
jgi:hypothetical protein